MERSFVVLLFLNSLSLGSTYAVIAVGMTLVFGVLRIFNFAHGELIMAGGFVAWLLLAQNDVPFFAAVLAAMAFVGGLAVAIERGFFKPTRADPFRGLIISIGLLNVLQVSALLIFGPVGKSVPTAIPGQVEVLGTTFGLQKIMVIAIVAAVLILVWILLERTRFGRAVRACIQDAEAASLYGISRNRMSTIVMFIAGALAGLAGVILSQMIGIGPFTGSLVILKAFVVVIVGGMGSVGGTVLASFMFGSLDTTVSVLFHPRFANLADVIIMLLVLMIRPRGLFGRE